MRTRNEVEEEEEKRGGGGRGQGRNACLTASNKRIDGSSTQGGGPERRTLYRKVISVRVCCGAGLRVKDEC